MQMLMVAADELETSKLGTMCSYIITYTVVLCLSAAVVTPYW